MSHKILISNDSKPFTKLNDWCNEHSIHLIRTSFIKTTAVSGLEIPTTDWIFFSSPKCVETYLENYPILAKKIAVYGIGTAETVQKRGIKIDFTGPNARDAAIIAQELEKVVSGSILFPISQISRKSIINEISDLNCISLVTYTTEIVSKEVTENPTIIIFTSPSNVSGYLLQNKVDKSIQLVAFGTTTAKAIEAFKLPNTMHILASPQEVEIIKTLETLLN